MSNVKNVIKPYLLVNNASLAGNFTSPVENVQYLDNVGIQMNFTGAPIGSFDIQISQDYAESNTNGQSIVVTNVGNWVSVPLVPGISAAGAPGSAYVELSPTTAPWVRVVYTRTGGAGNLNIYITAKAV